jgi:hypothetical protein
VRFSSAAFLLLAAVPLAAQDTPAYRKRLLGVYDSQTGDPVEGVEVSDLFAKLTATTSPTGTVSLAFLPEGETMIRIRKVGYTAKTMLVVISPIDTLPYTILLERSAQVLPTVVTKDSSVRKWRSPGLQAFEERRRAGFGQFLTDSILRRYDSGPLTSAIRRLSGVAVNCRGSVCMAISQRALCAVKIYQDGIAISDRNLEQMQTFNYSGVEYYNTASIPPQYNQTGNACGVLLLWTRERL